MPVNNTPLNFTIPRYKMGLSTGSTFTILLTVPFYSLVCAFEVPNEKTFSTWSSLLESKILHLVSSVTEVEFAKNVYRADATVQVQKVDGERVLASVLKELNLLLTSKKLALKKLVDHAEERYVASYRLNKTITNVEDLSYVDIKASKIATQMNFSSRFRQPVSYERSGVHVPLEIFDGWMGPRYKEAWWHDSDILKGLDWSASLDEVFKANQKNDPDLKWQYFGSYFGFMRVYPAFRWPDHSSLPDLFDVRRRSWYIHTSVTPKDVIMLIDRSGSVHGPTLDIMKITARALLNSLGENDFVNVAWFNNKVKWVVPCINTLVQATSQTKRLLGDAVEKLTESNLTSYSAALDFAFEQFKKFDEIKKPWVGSNCHKVVMFLSDGGTEWPANAIGRHCNESRDGRIKIFTFACGPHPIPTVVLKEMACSTGGYFSSVTALGSVRIKIRDYIKVLSRPLARSGDGDQYQWHNFHRDVGGLGMVTTVTLPVFDKTLSERKAVHLLGVMGIDVAIKEMTDLFPKHLLGSFGYAFAINTNGFVVFHPRLHDHIIYLEDPPNVYLTDLEGAQKAIEEMEISIIDGKKGFLKEVESIVPVGLGQAVITPIDYFYGSIEASTFRFGIALPSNHTKLYVNISSVNESLTILSSMKGASIAPWKYCSRRGTFEDDRKENEDITIQKLIQMIADAETSCDKYLIGRLLWDARNALEIVHHWNRSPGSWIQVRSRFLITGGGLMVVRTPEGDEKEKNRIGQTDPFKNNFFRRASLKGGFVFLPSKGGGGEVTVAGGVTLRNGHVAAVIGAEMKQETINKIFLESLYSYSGENCNSSEILHCYLLNDGGLIVASNIQSSKPGNFIGIHDAEILETLVAEGVIKREYRFNYQSWCSRGSRQIHAKASSPRSPMFKCLYDAIAGHRWNFIYTAFLYLVSGVSAWKKSENAGSDTTFEGGNHSCVTRSAWYYHGGIDARSGIINCQFGTRTFRLRYLSDLSLLFLVSQPPCDDSRFFRPVTLDTNEDVEFHYCQDRQHYRIRPEKCFSQTPKEVFRDCGAASESHIRRSDGMVFFSLSILFFSNRRNAIN